MSDSLTPHGVQHARLPGPLPAPGACSNSCPSRWWCRPTISSSVSSFSSCLQSFSASGSLPQWLDPKSRSKQVFPVAHWKCERPCFPSRVPIVLLVADTSSVFLLWAHPHTWLYLVAVQSHLLVPPRQVPLLGWQWEVCIIGDVGQILPASPEKAPITGIWGRTWPRWMAQHGTMVEGCQVGWGLHSQCPGPSKMLHAHTVKLVRPLLGLGTFDVFLNCWNDLFYYQRGSRERTLSSQNPLGLWWESEHWGMRVHRCEWVGANGQVTQPSWSWLGTGLYCVFLNVHSHTFISVCPNGHHIHCRPAMRQACVVFWTFPHELRICWKVAVCTTSTFWGLFQGAGGGAPPNVSHSWFSLNFPLQSLKALSLLQFSMSFNSFHIWGCYYFGIQKRGSQTGHMLSLGWVESAWGLSSHPHGYYC